MARVDASTRFWSMVSRGAPAECWVWQAAKFDNGYGAFNAGGRQWRAHRYVWTITHGRIQEGLLVLHRCDNPPCVNPSHLFLGTPLDNMRDKVSKGRQSRVRGFHKLTTEQVEEIRKLLRLGKTQGEIAECVGTTQPTVSRIAGGKIWRPT